MRLITRKKIWRAYPELDQFDDETCQRYINRSWHLLETFRGWFLAFVTVIVTLIAWFAFDLLLRVQILQFAPKWLSKPGNPIADLLGLVIFLGYFLVPWIAYLYVRDLWLQWQIRLLLAGVRCPHCKYSLLGLIVYSNEEDRCVKCPECAFELTLSNDGVTEADINPNLLDES